MLCVTGWAATRDSAAPRPAPPRSASPPAPFRAATEAGAVAGRGWLWARPGGTRRGGRDRALRELPCFTTTPPPPFLKANPDHSWALPNPGPPRPVTSWAPTNQPSLRPAPRPASPVTSQRGPEIRGSQVAVKWSYVDRVFLPLEGRESVFPNATEMQESSQNCR